MDASEALNGCVELVELGMKVEEDEEDEEEEDGSGLTAADVMSRRLVATGPGGMAAVAAIHTSTSGASRANWPPSDARPLSPDTETGDPTSHLEPCDRSPRRTAPRDERLRVASYITDASMRRRVAHRLLRKIRFLVDQYAVRCGQQIAVVTAHPARTTARRRSAATISGHDMLGVAADGLGKELTRETFTCRVVGTEPLSTALRQHGDASMLTFSNHLLREQSAQRSSAAATASAISLFGHDYEASMPPPPPPPPVPTNQNGYALPLLQVDGMPTTLDSMTQSDLRVFIPFMLKSALGRGKPFWSDPRSRPAWWPDHVLPWANIKCDTRSPKQKLVCRAWTDALRELVRVCYRHHGLEHLLDMPSACDSPPDASTAAGKRRSGWQLSPPGPAPEEASFGPVEDHLLGEVVPGPSADLLLTSPPVVCHEAPVDAMPGVVERRSLPSTVAGSMGPTVFVPTTILLDLKLRPGMATSIATVASPPNH